MKRPIVQFCPTKDGTDTLYSLKYGQTYHSAFGARTEAEHVFLQGTLVARRLQQGEATRVLEVGFGTGLNFFVTGQLSYQNSAPLDYVALENQLLSSDILENLNHHALSPTVQPQFLAWLAGVGSPVSPDSLVWTPTGPPQLTLTLIIDDAAQTDIPRRKYHAIYHDPFSPEVNPELWTPDFFNRLYSLLAPGGRLATYSVKGEVRRSLRAVGFEVSKRPGPPGKREVLVAVRP
jgi:tRNA U34 5-methylaminomethyl-2-thiouridine-forming methyltransferase MnmC